MVALARGLPRPATAPAASGLTGGCGL